MAYEDRRPQRPPVMRQSTRTQKLKVRRADRPRGKMAGIRGSACADHDTGLCPLRVLSERKCRRYTSIQICPHCLTSAHMVWSLPIIRTSQLIGNKRSRRVSIIVPTSAYPCCTCNTRSRCFLAFSTGRFWRTPSVGGCNGSASPVSQTQTREEMQAGAQDYSGSLDGTVGFSSAY